MAYKGDTVKFRISSPNGTWRTVESQAEVAVDRIETTRILHKRTKESDS